MRKKPSPSPVALLPPVVIGFTVAGNGNLSNIPTRFSVGSNEMVLWLVGNTSGHPVTVSLTNFLFNNSNAVQPFAWVLSDTLQLNDGHAGFIAGLKNPAYKQQGLIDPVKYTIHVQADDNGFTPQDYDPDGDIKP